MDESTTRETFTGTKAAERELHLFRDVTESRFGMMSERFDRVEQTLGQHGLALTELAADVASLQATLAEHGRKLQRAER
jgi:hypothetical protein